VDKRGQKNILGDSTSTMWGREPCARRCMVGRLTCCLPYILLWLIIYTTAQGTHWIHGHALPPSYACTPETCDHHRRGGTLLYHFRTDGPESCNERWETASGRAGCIYAPRAHVSSDSLNCRQLPRACDVCAYASPPLSVPGVRPASFRSMPSAVC
jgi:hypothetical protein